MALASASGIPEALLFDELECVKGHAGHDGTLTRTKKAPPRRGFGIAEFRACTVFHPGLQTDRTQGLMDKTFAR